MAGVDLDQPLCIINLSTNIFSHGVVASIEEQWRRRNDNGYGTNYTSQINYMYHLAQQT